MKKDSMRTLKDSLQMAISEQHARMEALPFISALTEGKLPIESYVGMLRAMAIIHGTLEHEIAQLPSSDITALIVDRPSRLVHLRKDLSIFDGQFFPDMEESLAQCRKIAEKIRLYRIEKPISLVGILYVLEGMTLGNTVHLQDVLSIFGCKTLGEAHYFSGYGKETARNWNHFCSAINALPIDKEGCESLIQVSLDLFDHLEAIFSSLYPLQKSDLKCPASNLNPEAGDHAIPKDAREIQAAVKAAEKCFGEFPYYNERYKDRGKGFAKSDAAWLVTLTELTETQMPLQVEWLGRVLGNRGMPRIMLERQLELLHDELVLAVPEKTDIYKGFLRVAEKLKRERTGCISESAFNRLTTSFYLATDNELQGRFKKTGALIVAAVCDRKMGISGAVSSLIPWLTDAERFSPEWMVAVGKTMEDAVRCCEQTT